MSETREIFFTIADLCKRYGVGDFTVREWCKSGRVPHFKIGGRYFFHRNEILEMEKTNVREKTSMPTPINSMQRELPDTIKELAEKLENIDNIVHVAVARAIEETKRG